MLMQHIVLVRALKEPAVQQPYSASVTLLYQHIIMASDTEAIKATLNAYRDALVASNVPAVVKLYTKDGVAMAQGFPTQVGIEEVEKWYGLCFELITLNVTFDFKEIVVVSNEYAFARTTSAGTQKLNAAGTTSAEANQELFVMQKVDGEWKIARYSFSTTNPPDA